MLRFFKIRNGLIQEISKEDENFATLQKEANWIDARQTGLMPQNPMTTSDYSLRRY